MQWRCNFAWRCMCVIVRGLWMRKRGWIVIGRKKSKKRKWNLIYCVAVLNWMHCKYYSSLRLQLRSLKIVCDKMKIFVSVVDISMSCVRPSHVMSKNWLVSQLMMYNIRPILLFIPHHKSCIYMLQCLPHYSISAVYSFSFLVYATTFSSSLIHWHSWHGKAKH